MRDICIYTNFLFVLTNLKNKLVEKYLEYKFSKNNSKELSKNLKQIVPKASRQFIEWFVGFTDAEGCFYISSLKNVNYVTFKFIIELHKDDIEILYKICEILGIGKVSISGDSARFTVNKFEEIVNVLIPIFQKFPLQTTKYLDFTCFLQAIMIKNKVGLKGSLSQQEKDIITQMKESMNTKRLIISEKEENLLNQKVSITKWWLLGFIEGEGTFGYKYLVPYFQIAQHKKNLYVLEAIEEFLFKLFKEEIQINLNQEEFQFIYTLNKFTGVYSMSILKVEWNFYYIIPFFESLQFLSRKKIDYNYWVLMIFMHKLGYYYLPEGKKIALQISSTTNKFRYTTNDNKIELPNIESIINLFDQNPPFNNSSELSHFEKIRELTIAKGGRKGFTVYIYECEYNKLKEVPVNNSRTIRDICIYTGFLEVLYIYKNIYILIKLRKLVKASPFISTDLPAHRNQIQPSATKSVSQSVSQKFLGGFRACISPRMFFYKSIKQFSTRRSYPNNNLSLVVWGTNLTCQVGTGKFTKQVSNMIKLPPYLLSVIIGLILSDGWLIFASKTNKNALLGFAQSGKNSKYFWFVFLSLSHYCSAYPIIRYRTRLGSPTVSLQFFTRSLPCFTELYTWFYPKGKKLIPSNLYDLLTPVALAHLIMGDGEALKQGLRLCTDSYEISEVVKLMNVLMIKYRISCSINIIGGKPRIYIRAKSMSLLISIVKPHMSNDMLYKLESGKK